MSHPLKSVFTSINIAGRDIELCLSKPAIELFIKNVEDLKPEIGFTAYEFAHLIYACEVTAANKKDSEPEMDFIEIYEAVNTLTNSREGQCEIERVAKLFMTCEAHKELLESYIRK